MAIVFWERVDSRPVDLSESSQLQTWTYNAIADDGEDETDVYAAILTDLDEEKNGLVRQRIKIDPVPGREDRWTVTLDYGPEGQDGTGDAVGAEPSDPAEATPSEPGSEGATPSEEPLGPGYTFEISAETQHITHSRRTFGPVVAGAVVFEGAGMTRGALSNVVKPNNGFVSEDDIGMTVWITTSSTGFWRPGAYTITGADAGAGSWTLDRDPAPSGVFGTATYKVLPKTDNEDKPDKFNYKGAIGYNGDRIEGCDVFTAKLEMTRTTSVAGMSMAYIATLYRLVGKKNDAPFYSFAAGELVYLGASISYAQGNRYSVVHKFLASANEADIAIVPGELTVPYKRGWDYLWVRYNSKAENGSVAPRAAAAFVEEVTADADFSLIGIGV